MKITTLAGVAFAAIAAMAMRPAQATAVAVDLELQLLVDVSSSITSEEFALQQSGYANAFRDPRIINLLTSGALGAVAVEVVYFSSENEEEIVVGWTEINGAASANAVADLIDAATRPDFTGGTGIGSALDNGFRRFETNEFDSAQQVIDISANGRNNSGIGPDLVRDAALAAGIDMINALVIDEGGPIDLEAFFVSNVIGGEGAFALLIDSFDDFGTAIIEKLSLELINDEIGEIPPPAAFYFMMTGVGGLLWRRRRRRQ